MVENILNWKCPNHWKIINSLKCFNGWRNINSLKCFDNWKNINNWKCSNSWRNTNNFKCSTLKEKILKLFIMKSTQIVKTHKFVSQKQKLNHHIMNKI
jgi:hypothetical protein